MLFLRVKMLYRFSVGSFTFAKRRATRLKYQMADTNMLFESIQ